MAARSGAPIEEEDASELKLGEDFVKAKCLMNAEVALVLQRKYEHLQQLADDPSAQISQYAFHLIKAFGNALTDSQLDELYKHADINKDGKVNADELATLVAQNALRTFRVKACPVCGEKLGNTDLMNDIIHMSLCFDEGTGNQIMTGAVVKEEESILNKMQIVKQGYMRFLFVFATRRGLWRPGFHLLE